MDGAVVWPVLYLLAGVAVTSAIFGWWMGQWISNQLSTTRHDLRGEFQVFVTQSEERLVKRIDEIEQTRRRNEDDVKYEIRALRELLERIFAHTVKREGI